jgi:uncharacterized protein (DUF2237 family)
MLRDDRTDGGDRRPASRNVLGEPLEICSLKPMTGFYRDGCCDTGREAQDRAPRHAIAFSMPPALALYCASGLVL